MKRSKVPRLENHLEKSGGCRPLKFETVPDTARNIEEQRQFDRRLSRVTESLDLLPNTFLFKNEIFSGQVADRLPGFVRHRDRYDDQGRVDPDGFGIEILLPVLAGTRLWRCGRFLILLLSWNRFRGRLRFDRLLVVYLLQSSLQVTLIQLAAFSPLPKISMDCCRC